MKKDIANTVKKKFIRGTDELKRDWKEFFLYNKSKSENLKYQNGEKQIISNNPTNHKIINKITQLVRISQLYF